MKFFISRCQRFCLFWWRCAILLSKYNKQVLHLKVRSH